MYPLKKAKNSSKNLNDLMQMPEGKPKARNIKRDKK